MIITDHVLFLWVGWGDENKDLNMHVQFVLCQIPLGINCYENFQIVLWEMLTSIM